MLVRLTEIINYKAGIDPICLPWRQLETVDLTATVNGCGMRESDTYTKILRVEVQIIENRVCRDWFRAAQITPKLKDTELYAGYKAGGKDSCTRGPITTLIFEKAYLVGW